MTRFAWLQSRTQTLTVATALAILAVAAAVTGIHLSHLYDNLVASCLASHNPCGAATDQFLSHDTFLQDAFTLLMRLAPALLGIFWGAPLLTREFESGTFRLAWTQSVSRSRWLVTRLALSGLVVLLIAGLLSLTVTWWYRSIDLAGTNRYDVFDARDIAPIGYTVFAFALGAFLGAVIRRTVPAMAATLVGFVAARVVFIEWVRPHLMSPLHMSTSLLNADRFGFGSNNGSDLMMIARGAAPDNAWQLSSHLVTSSGQTLTPAANTAFLHQYCSSISFPPPVPRGSGRVLAKLPDANAFEACRAQAARLFHLSVTYQPAGRYWTFQWLETGLFVLLAMAALAGCYWWVTKRAS